MLSLQAAQQSGDIATILKLISQTAELKPSDFIKKTLGSILYVYYYYIDNLHLRPLDVEDLVDGLLYIESKQYLEKRAYDRATEARKHV